MARGVRGAGSQQVQPGAAGLPARGDAADARAWALMSFVKHAASARAAAWEMAGLDWLRVDGGAAVVDVLAVDESSLELERLSPTAPSPAAAEAFGRALAATHASGASAYGVGPDDWDGDGYQGPADDLLALPLRPYSTWGAMYADLRIAPLTER